MSEQSDVARLEEIRQRWAKATPGPWQQFANGGKISSSGMEYGPTYAGAVWGPKGPGYGLVADCREHTGLDVENAEAIAAAPTDIAWLIALANRAVEAEAEMRECHMCRMTNNWHD